MSKFASKTLIILILAILIPAQNLMSLEQKTDEKAKWEPQKVALTNSNTDEVYTATVDFGWASTVTPPEFIVNLTGAVVVFIDHNKKLRKINLEGTTSTVISSDPDLEQIQFDSEGNLYIIFSEKQTISATVYSDNYLLANGNSYILVKVDPSDNSVVGIDKDLSEMVWNTNTVSPNIQFDGSGNIYYLAETGEGKIVLRKYVSESDITNYINENIEVNHWLVLSDGTVVIGGKTISTQTNWLRKISPAGAISYLATPAEVGWILELPDNRVYAGLPDLAPYNGVYKLSEDLSYIDNAAALTPYIGFESKGYTPDYDVDEIATGHDATYCRGFTDAGGVYLLGYAKTDDNKIIGLTGAGNYRTVLYYYPTPEIIELQLVDRITLMRESLNELVIPGTRLGVNKLILYNLTTKHELNILYENIEIYHLDVLSSGTILFDGLHFDNNEYIVGMFERAAGSSDGTVRPLYGYKELARLRGKCHSFQILEPSSATISVAITSPAHGAPVSGTIDVQATASADNGVSKVEFYIDDTLKATDTTSPYSYSWNTLGYTDDYHTIKAIVYDTQSQTAEDQISVLVQNNVTVQYTLTVAAGTGGTTDPAPGAHTYNSGSEVDVTATPDSGYTFSSWSGDVPSGHENDNPVTITMNTNKSIAANFASQTQPTISLSLSALYFGASTTGEATSSQTFVITNTGGSTMNWSISDDANWLSCTHASGTGDTVVGVSVDPTGLAASTYKAAGTYSGAINVTDPNASNSPQSIAVTLEVYAAGTDSAPFGSFDTPIDASTVSGSIPVTGWVLDDIGVDTVEIKRDSDPDDPAAAIGADGLVWIGNAIFVKGARTDVEGLYPNYPHSDRAGWGYMLLTYGLPRQGNGTFTLHAIAEDATGTRVLLGTKTITSDNANRVKPFGTIDTPAQGGVVSGSNYVNFGWALTPPPKMIPTDGSTMRVYVNSVLLGNPNYNNFRSDIANQYPTYLNKDGASGHYFLDTTQYPNGVHTIGWEATDDQGEADGMGSRFFEILNLGASSASAAGMESTRYAEDMSGRLSIDVEGDKEIEIEELGRIELKLKGEGGTRYIGWGENNSKTLPIGSTLDRKTGVFYWMPGPGFLGKHILHFAVTDGIHMSQPVEVVVNIVPKKYNRDRTNRIDK